MSKMILRELMDLFESTFGERPTIAARAPGRVNLIGEHTDYNGGFVFPAAIDREITILARPTEGPSHWVSRELGASEFDVQLIGSESPAGWARYGASMAWSLGVQQNFQAVLASTIPMGSGVSSSAAMEMAFGYVYLALAGATMPAPELALAAQKGENQFVGVNCGIMDQMASAMGRPNQAFALDTRSLNIEYAPLPDDLAIVLLDTKKPRALTESAYNERRSQCEQAAAILGVPQLRDATYGQLEDKSDAMEDVIYRRARHIITENARVREFRAALAVEDRRAIGELMSASHVSLRDDYEVSCLELDQMWEAALKAPGIVGVRMTGAGFGGCCVALVEAGKAAEFEAATLRAYDYASGRMGEAMVCRAVMGAETLQIEAVSPEI